MSVFRFGVFVFDARSGDLTRDGRRVHLQPQPAQVLGALLARAGEVVDREELRRAVWPTDTFVDFERGLNFCVAQVRSALGDAAGSPRFIRTIPRRGYAFVCPVERVAATVPAIGGAAPTPRSRPGLVVTACIAATIAAAAGAAIFRGVRSPDLPIVAIAGADNETGDPSLARFGGVLVDTLVEQLTTRGAGRFAVVGNAAILRVPRDQRDLGRIAAALRARYVILTEVQRDEQRLRVLAHLIRLPEQTHIRVSRTDGIVDRTLPSTDAIAARIAATFVGAVERGDQAPSPGFASH
jgi:DNA-binding winged helix-turn-helix (wHTH) protein/TolB-like protein